MHTLFALEDMYGLKIGEIGGEICLRLDKSDYSTYMSMFDMFHAWQEQATKLEQGEITKEEYDQWRYKYPELDTSKHWAKVSSQTVSDVLMEEFKKIEKEEKKTSKKKNKNVHKKTLPIFSFHNCNRTIVRLSRHSSNVNASIPIFLIARANQQGFLYAIDVIIQCMMV